MSGAFSIMWANGSPGSTSPAKVRNTGRTASFSLESVTTMSRIGCAFAATASHTPSVSNMRRAAAAIAEARGSGLRIRRKGRIGDHDPERGPEPLAQREREREAGEAAARDHHIRNHRLVSHRSPVIWNIPSQYQFM